MMNGMKNGTAIHSCGTRRFQTALLNHIQKKNTAIIFVTTEQSWHGVPNIIQCPNDIYRKTLAFYYVSDIKNEKNVDKLGANENGFRKKAVFVKRPSDPYDERMEALYKIRPHRLITDQDMQNIWSDWNITL